MNESRLLRHVHSGGLGSMLLVMLMADWVTCRVPIKPLHDTPHLPSETQQNITDIFFVVTRNMFTNDVVQMLCKPPSHIWLICHFTHKVQDKIKGK